MMTPERLAHIQRKWSSQDPEDYAGLDDLFELLEACRDLMWTQDQIQAELDHERSRYDDDVREAVKLVKDENARLREALEAIRDASHYGDDPRDMADKALETK